MIRTFTAADRSALIRLASSLPAGSAERADILFIVEHARPVRVASSGRVVYAFSFSSLKADFWAFVKNLADKVLELADLQKKVKLTPEAEREINRACEAAVKALDKVNSSKQASHRKDANLLGVAAMGAALGKTAESAHRGNPADAAVALYMVALAFFPVTAAILTCVGIYSSYEYYVNGEEFDTHAGLRRKAKAVLDFAKGKGGFVKKVVGFLSKFLHSDPTPDPFGDRGATFELYGLWKKLKPAKERKDDYDYYYVFAHPFGKVSLQEADDWAASGDRFGRAIWESATPVRYTNGEEKPDSQIYYANSSSRNNVVSLLLKDLKDGTWWATRFGKPGAWFQYPESKAKDLVKQVRKVPNL